MTLSKLISVLGKVNGSGHPAYLRTPDGSLWVPSEVENRWRITDTDDRIVTTVHLVPATGDKK